jgi:hypothetical protein
LPFESEAVLGEFLVELLDVLVLGSLAASSHLLLLELPELL